MKILYSQIKTLVPGLKADAHAVGEALTLTGFMMDSFTEVSFKGKKDYLLGLEVRQNRADGLSEIGIAREVAAYYGLEAQLPEIKEFAVGDKKLDIKVTAKDEVKRVMAIEIGQVKNATSPAWLQEFLKFYDLNSINLLVDLSNYVMIITGYPSHLIDCTKISGSLTWAVNKDFSEVTTLDGTKIELKKEQDKELIIRDDKNIVALAGVVGARYAEIGLDTTRLIAEVALYDRAVIRSNSRSLHIVTEASHRLEKDLDPNGAEYALKMLASLIMEHAGGVVSSAIFDYYSKKHTATQITFDPKKVSIFAGVEISEVETLKILKQLRFEVQAKGEKLLVTPPLDRMDVSLEADVIEEVIRIFGFNKIPTDQIPHLAVVKNITPKIIKLADKIKDVLAYDGWDEILSWSMTKNEMNQAVNYRPWEVIATQNSVNDEYPELRQSLAAGLLPQLEEFSKKNVEFINIFEIGKIFGKEKKDYIEIESLGLLTLESENNFLKIKNTVETVLRQIGLNDISYAVAEVKPEMANPYTTWNVFVNNKLVGIIYKLKNAVYDGAIYFAEINLTLVNDLLEQNHWNPAIEITQKIITLDANVELAGGLENINKYLTQVTKKIGLDNIWSIRVYDVFALKDNKVRYTIRVSYKELSDPDAKKLHLTAFGLSS